MEPKQIKTKRVANLGGIVTKSAVGCVIVVQINKLNYFTVYAGYFNFTCQLQFINQLSTYFAYDMLIAIK